jgi:hypothetical protein
MVGSVEYLTHIIYTWRYRWLDNCFNDKEFELCISPLIGNMTEAFCLMVRNTLIMDYSKEWKNFYGICGYAPLKDHSVPGFFRDFSSGEEFPNDFQEKIPPVKARIGDCYKTMKNFKDEWVGFIHTYIYILLNVQDLRTTKTLVFFEKYDDRFLVLGLGLMWNHSGLYAIQ